MCWPTATANLRTTVTSAPTPMTSRRCATTSRRSTSRLYLAGVLNSFVVDWQLGFRVTANVNMFYVYELPVPRLRESDGSFEQSVLRAAKLICRTEAFDRLAKAARLSPADHRAGVTNPIERAKLRAELDAIVAHLYQLTEEE